MDEEENETLRDVESGIDELLAEIDVDEAIAQYEELTDPYRRRAA